VRRLPLLISVCLFSLPCVVAAAADPPRIDFNRDIRPILSENCFACHGFDDKARKGKLRLDTKDGAFKPRDHQPIIAGNPDKSEVIRRIATTDPDDHMPPPDSGKKLTPRQVDLIKQWITQGAPYTGHWSFQPIKEPALPQVTNPAWCRNDIDRFILARPRPRRT